MQFSSEQSLAMEKFRQGHNIFVTGEAGTGKSAILRKMVNEMICNGKKFQVCAMTGRAAILLNCGARTLHSWSGIGLGKGDSEDIVNRATGRRNVSRAWKSVDILLIDEVSMMSRKLFDILNDIAKISRKCFHRPFGGLQVVFFGDFFQLAPIEETSDEETGQYCFESEIWMKTFALENHIQLKTIFRQEDEVLKKILSQVRRGRITRKSHEILNSRVGVVDGGCGGAAAATPTKLFPLRASVNNYNQEMFNKLDTELIVYEMNVKTNNVTMCDTGEPIPTEILAMCRRVPLEQLQNEIHFYKENSSCCETLHLKKGALVMLCVNLSVEDGLCNGSQGVIIDFVVRGNVDGGGAAAGRRRFPVVEFTNGIVRTIEEKCFQHDKYPILSFSQIPLILAWAVSIHKMQGSQIDMGEIDIGSGIFAVGQTYVALSRVRTLEGIYLLGYDPAKIKVSQKVVDFYNLLDGGSC